MTEIHHRAFSTTYMREIDAAIDAPQSVTVKATAADISQHVRTRVKGVNAIPFAKFRFRN